MKNIVSAFIVCFAFQNIMAQVNIRPEDVLFKKRIVRSMPMNSDFNKSIFGTKNTLVKILLDAYEKGELNGYKESDCTENLQWDSFLSNVNDPNDSLATCDYIKIGIVELNEDLIIDKHRSEVVFDMESITLVLPEGQSRRGIREPLVSFKFDDCVNVFKKQDQAVAINPLSNGRNINYAEVFLLRLFQSHIVKIDNPNDLYFDQMANNELMAFLESKKAENELTEKIYKLFNPK